MVYSPGQTLPPFPPPTHGLPGLPSLVTLHQSLQNISPNFIITPLPTHRFCTLDLYQPYPGTIIASGNAGKIVHLCGTQYFLLQEFARIQTFSDSHVLGKTRVKKQSRCRKRLSGVV